MRNGSILFCILLIAFAAGAPLLHGILGLLGGLIIAPIAVVGALLLVGFILLLVFSGVGIIGAGVLGLVGLVLLVALLPLALPLLIIGLPILLLVKLARG
jgi:hypothetical protein